MTGNFLGAYSNSVNKKKWIIIPAPLKKKIEANSRKSVIITIGPTNNIAIYPIDEWDLLMSKLSNENAREKKFKLHLITFAIGAQTYDEMGRVKVTDTLLKMAGIDDKIIIKGEGNYISVWNPDKYYDYELNMLKEHKETYNSLDYLT